MVDDEGAVPGELRAVGAVNHQQVVGVEAVWQAEKVVVPMVIEQGTQRDQRRRGTVIGDCSVYYRRVGPHLAAGAQPAGHDPGRQQGRSHLWQRPGSGVEEGGVGKDCCEPVVDLGRDHPAQLFLGRKVVVTFLWQDLDLGPLACIFGLPSVRVTGKRKRLNVGGYGHISADSVLQFVVSNVHGSDVDGDISGPGVVEHRTSALAVKSWQLLQTPSVVMVGQLHDDSVQV